MNQLPKAKYSDIIIQETAKELLLYDLTLHKAFCLNETAAFVWQNCDGKTTLDELKKLSHGKLTDDVIFLTLDELQKQNLLQEKVETGISNDGMSRRKMIAKYGTLAVSLPMITTLVAPTPAHAQSISTCFASGFLLADQVTDCNNCSVANFDNLVAFCCSGSLAVPINVSCNPLAGFPGVFTCTAPCA